MIQDGYTFTLISGHFNTIITPECHTNTKDDSQDYILLVVTKNFFFIPCSTEFLPLKRFTKDFNGISAVQDRIIRGDVIMMAGDQEVIDLYRSNTRVVTLQRDGRNTTILMLFYTKKFPTILDMDLNNDLYEKVVGVNSKLQYTHMSKTTSQIREVSVEKRYPSDIERLKHAFRVILPHGIEFFINHDKPVEESTP